ncbi:hypothetical protein Bca101_055770 [Brassica carinata]
MEWRRRRCFPCGERSLSHSHFRSLKLEDGFLLVVSFSRFSFRICYLEDFPISAVELFETVAREASDLSPSALGSSSGLRWFRVVCLRVCQFVLLLWWSLVAARRDVVSSICAVSSASVACCCSVSPMLLGSDVVALRVSVSLSFASFCFVTSLGSGWVFDNEQTSVGLSTSSLLGGYSPEVVFLTGLTALYGLSGSRGVHGPGLDSWGQQSSVLFPERRHRRYWLVGLSEAVGAGCIKSWEQSESSGLPGGENGHVYGQEIVGNWNGSDTTLRKISFLILLHLEIGGILEHHGSGGPISNFQHRPNLNMLADWDTWKYQTTRAALTSQQRLSFNCFRGLENQKAAIIWNILGSIPP